MAALQIIAALILIGAGAYGTLAGVVFAVVGLEDTGVPAKIDPDTARCLGAVAACVGIAIFITGNWIAIDSAMLP